MRAMLSLGGADKHTLAAFPEIAQAVARASTVDPLFPDELAGAEATAAILLAVAWRSSRFQAYSRSGPYLGLFRLRPPVSPPVTAQSLLLPRSSTLLAVDLLRYSFTTQRAAPLSDRLAVFRDWGRCSSTPSPEGVAWSRETMLYVPRLAARLVHAGESEPSGWAVCEPVQPPALPEPIPEPPKKLRRKRSPSRGASA